MRVALTGGVGSGKSTVATMFAELGAVVVDADAIAREVVAKGTPGFDAVITRFGDAVVGSDGGLDRPALAKIVFADDEQRAALNAVVHPLIGKRVSKIADEASADAILVYDVPLLVENDMAGGFEFVVVVQADERTRLERLAERGMDEADARARMAAQASDEQRRAVADEVLDNDATLEDLRAHVDAVWTRIERRAGGLDSP